MSYCSPDPEVQPPDNLLTEEQAVLVEEHRTGQYLAAETDQAYVKIMAREAALARVEEEKAQGHVYTWAQVDHDDAFTMSRNRLMPDIGHMTETVNSPPLPLFYRGKVNGVHGDSESGKSWLMQYVSVQELNAGHHVLYVDFEDDAGGVYRRLVSLGASEASIRDLFHYVNPQNKLTLFEQIEWAKLVAMDADHSLAVVDGVTEAMSLENLTGRDEGEVAKWHNLITKPLAVNGWGVGMIDHTPHGEARVIGSQHKRSAITGVSYSLDSVTSFAPGQCGKSIIRVDKDRPGGIRKEAAPGIRPQWYGTFVMDETLSFLQPSIWPWKPAAEEDAQGFEVRPPEAICDAITGYVRANPGCSTISIRDGVRGRIQTKNRALEWMIESKAIRTEDAGRNKIKHYIADRDES